MTNVNPHIFTGLQRMVDTSDYSLPELLVAWQGEEAVLHQEVIPAIITCAGGLHGVNGCHPAGTASG